MMTRQEYEDKLDKVYEKCDDCWIIQNRAYGNVYCQACQRELHQEFMKIREQFEEEQNINNKKFQEIATKVFANEY